MSKIFKKNLLKTLKKQRPRKQKRKEDDFLSEWIPVPFGLIKKEWLK